jgi:hypothetical protein
MKEENDSSSNYRMASFGNPSYEVAERLREEGYDIAGHMRVRRKTPVPNMIGVLKDRELVETNFLGFKSFFGYKLTRKPRALHLGRIWFNDEDKGAIENENWVFEANGTKEMFKLTKILEDIASSYNVKITSNLYSNIPKRERYLNELHQ